MAFATIDVTKGITGTIPVANGGTGLTSGTTGQFLKFTGSTTVASSAVDAGKVLQVQSMNYSTEKTRSITSFADTGLDLSITPSATTSKILVFGSCGNWEMSDNNTQSADVKVTRTISSTETDIIAQLINDGGAFTNLAGSVYRTFIGHASFVYLDTTNTTSAVQYKVRYKPTSTTGYAGVQMHSSTSSITAFEIGA
tara:strand:+ start:1510 stop:2100 length:591 start_codon:yes stop_codon:yes gene_type:complete